MTSGIAAAQARIAAIEHRFASMRPVERPAVSAFQQALVAATAELPGAQLLAAGAAPSAATYSPAPVAVQAQPADRPIGLLSPRAATPTAPTRPISTEMGPAGPPAELAAYGNGRIPAEALHAIQGGTHRLWAPAARSFHDMAAAAASEGVTLRVTDSYRSYDDQVDLARRKGLYSQGGLAAEPGTSNHGWGRSLDMDTDGGAVEWLRANGARFGFHEDVRREPWHWTYRPAA